MTDATNRNKKLDGRVPAALAILLLGAATTLRAAYPTYDTWTLTAKPTLVDLSNKGSLAADHIQVLQSNLGTKDGEFELGVGTTCGGVQKVKWTWTFSSDVTTVQVNHPLTVKFTMQMDQGACTTVSKMSTDMTVPHGIFQESHPNSYRRSMMRSFQTTGA